MKNHSLLKKLGTAIFFAVIGSLDARAVEVDLSYLGCSALLVSDGCADATIQSEGNIRVEPAKGRSNRRFSRTLVKVYEVDPNSPDARVVIKPAAVERAKAAEAGRTLPDQGAISPSSRPSTEPSSGNSEDSIKSTEQDRSNLAPRIHPRKLPVWKQ